MKDEFNKDNPDRCKIFQETSAYKDEGVKDLFKSLATEILKDSDRYFMKNVLEE